MEEKAAVRHRGGCHCGRVQFEIDASPDIDTIECNCSVCTKSGFLHLIVAQKRFRLLSGADELLSYTFNTGTAKHLFCKNCGIKSYYVPRSHPGDYSVNVRCLEPGTIRSIHIRAFDGQHWEENASALGAAKNDR